MAPASEESPIVAGKDHAGLSVFRPENLIREARRQKGLASGSVPAICVLDPDGDLVRALRASGEATRCDAWACYHTDLYAFTHGGERFGVVGCAVGAPFAVLVAEQLFVSGCRFLVSVTSAGQIVPGVLTSRFVLIDRALRDEGTSYHYQPPARFAHAAPDLAGTVLGAVRTAGMPIDRGTSWTTDAPFRETEAAIGRARREGVLAVEMEAAALYAFAAARGRDLLCFAQVTNQMAQVGDDFEKGEANGTRDVLRILVAAANAFRLFERTRAAKQRPVKRAEA
ncbi:MAG: nucleoside phosphorylase [Pseudomonadota bacterium]|nr:nucleoside phosphorylase [Pseudomonadota bacterium]